jgi:hypothetical protein
MKAILLVTTILFFAVFTQAQGIPSTIKAQGMDMAKALVKKDYTTFAKYMHPKVVEMAGGSAKLLQQMDTLNAMAAKFGAEIKKITIGNPAKIIKYKKELQTTIPQITEMTSSFGSLSMETTLVAISSDEGKTWKFVDTTVTNVSQLKKAMPELSPDLVIPAPKPPVIVPNKVQQ